MNFITGNKLSHVRTLNCEDSKLLVVVYFCYEYYKWMSISY